MNLPNPKLPECYYDAAKGAYIVTNGRGGWMPQTESNMRRRLKSQGFSTVLQPGETLSPLEDALLAIQDEHNIDYFGPLAGYPAGPREMLGGKVLVSTSPRLITPAPGEAPVLIKLIEGMLGDEPQHRQIKYFFGWLRVALDCLYSQQFRAGQTLVLAGPPECGKSLLQKLLTALFGGRDASPYQYMTGGTAFNSDLFGAEHLKIEDEAASTDIRVRREFGNHLKQISSPGSRRCHPKGREPFNLLPFWRLSVSVNAEPENLLVLPPIDDSVKDKVILLLCAKKPMPLPLATGDQRQIFEQTLLAELPAFVHWLRFEWEIPADLASARYGIADWQHPMLMEAIGDLAPETHLLMLIDRVLFSGLPGSWEGTASELQSKLFETFSVAREAQNLLKFPNACGTYLGRIARQRPNRVSHRAVNGISQWQIKPPAKMAEAA